jgi:hypothetical protein
MTPLPNHLRLDEPAVYRIFIQGRLDPKWSAEFSAMQIIPLKLNNGLTLTLLTGNVADQASLHGLLNKIRDYGLVLMGLVLTDMKLDEIEIPDNPHWSVQ